uniref:Uncharacterized protein n=1 Tax=Phlegmariurus squarrosus TaxID=73615 RepID=H9M8C7_PHLSQ|nr:hypothetical protein HusqMp137 [Phlegmariurus squarrosus]AEV55834.1 hypothetical protein HusqMp137 [Phlegmariurus squarrosus]
MGAPRPKAHSALTDESISVEPVNRASASWLLDAWGRGLVVPAYSSPQRKGGTLERKAPRLRRIRGRSLYLNPPRGTLHTQAVQKIDGVKSRMKLSNCKRTASTYTDRLCSLWKLSHH